MIQPNDYVAGDSVGSSGLGGPSRIDAKTAAMLNGVAAELERLGKSSVVAPLQLESSAGGRSLSLPRPPKIWGKLSGSANPYTFSEQVFTPGSGWTTVTGGLSDSCYEANGLTGLGGAVVHLTIGDDHNDWRFDWRRAACSSICVNVTHSGAPDSGVLVTLTPTSGSPTSGNTNSSGTICFTLPAGKYTCTVAGVSGSQALVLGPGCCCTYQVAIGGSTSLSGCCTLAITATNCVGLTPSSAAYTVVTNEVQLVKLTGSPTGGTFTLSFGGHTTSSIAWNASASTVQSALVALASIGTGNVAVSGTESSGWTVEFQGSLGGASQALLTGTPSLTGGTLPNVSITETQAGGVTAASGSIPTSGTAAVSVANGWYHVTVTATNYQTSSQDITLTASSPSGALTFNLQPVSGMIVMPGDTDPFTPPSALTVTDPLGATTLSLTSVSDGQAFYCGNNTFGTATIVCDWSEIFPACSPTKPNQTINPPAKLVTYNLTIGCTQLMTLNWMYNASPQHIFLTACSDGCSAPETPLACGSPTLASLDAFCSPEGNPCVCSPADPGPADLATSVTGIWYGMCFGTAAGLASSGPVDISFVTEQSPGNNCDFLWSSFWDLWGINNTSGGLQCVTVQVNE